VAAEDGTIAGLLGASPGASTAVPIMLGLLKRCFPEQYAGWEPTLKDLIPTMGQRLNDDAGSAEKSMSATASVLSLTA
jgi:malate dehydrogenase (quinone)